MSRSRNLKKKELEQLKRISLDLQIQLSALETPIDHLDFVDNDDDVISELELINKIGGNLQVLTAGPIEQLKGDS